MDRKALILKTAEIYREHAVAFEAMIPVVEKFDGKIYNKRFENSLQNAVKEVGIEHYSVSTITKYGDLRIEGKSHNNDFRYGTPDVNGYRDTGYTDNRDSTAYVGRYEGDEDKVFEATPGGKWRLKSDLIVKKLMDHVEDMINRAELVESVLNNQSKMESEFQKVANAFKSFNEKWGYEARTLMGLLFDLRYVGNIGWQNYNVKIH